jgi:N-succinyldiaminopimelate aminotransferase
VAGHDPLVERMHGFGTTIFAEMSALALETGSVNLGQGFPDTDGPNALLEAAVDAIRSGHNQYPPGPGIPELRRAVAAHQRRYYRIGLDADTEVLVTAGATEAIAAAVLALAGPGDEVLMFEPYYDSYAATVALGGAHRRTVTLERAGQEWTFDEDRLRAAITPATRAVLLNTPHNPTGKVFSRDELTAVAAVAIEHDLVVIADEVYEHLTFDGRAHLPISTLPGMAERTISIGSAGKMFSVTGWKIGWITGPARLITAVRTVKQFLTYVNGAPFQPAVAKALDDAERHVPELRGKLQQQRDLLCDGLRDLGWDVVVPQATYFATVDVGRDAVRFCRELPARAGVVAIPSSVFYDSRAGDTYVRFAFCKRPAMLAEALDRLKRTAV